MTGEYVWLHWALGIVVFVLLLLAWVVWMKSRPFMPGDVFHASRLSRGNRLFPTQVAITPTSVVQLKPRWIGKQEQTIHLAHVSSVNIDTGMMLSNVLIETSGGSDPIACHGHRKGDAVRMKQLIELYQTEHFRNQAGPGRMPPAKPSGTVEPGPISR